MPRYRPSLSDLVVLLIALKVFLVIVAFDPLGADPFALPKAMASRAVLYVTIPLAAAAVVIEGVRLRPGRIWYLAAAVVALASVATLTAVDQTTALYGAPRRLLGLTSIIDGAATAALLATFAGRVRTAAVVGAAFVAAVVVNLAYAMLQLLRLDPVKWIDPALNGTIGNSTSFAALMAVAFALAWTAALLICHRATLPARVGLASLIVATAGAVALSGARAPALALPAAAVAGAAVALRVRPIPAATLRRLIPVAAIGGLVAIAALLISPAGARLTALAQGGDTSFGERQLIYRISLDSLAARPLLGVGPDGLIAVYQSLRPPEAAQMADVIAAAQTSTHGWLLGHAVGIGVVGATAILALLIVALWRAWKTAREQDGIVRAIAFAGLVAFASQGFFTVSSIPVELLFWCLVGLIAADPLDPSDAPARGWRDPVLRRIGVAVAALIGIALALTTLGAAEAQRALLLSNVARQRGDVSAATRWGSEATRLDPRRADHWNALGLAFSRREPPAAIQAFQRASDLAPYDAVYLLNLAADEALHAPRDPAYRDRALRHAREAVARDPNWPVTLRRASEIFALFGQRREAIELAERVLALAPVAAYHDWASRVYAQFGDLARAIEHLEAAGRLWSGGGPLAPEIRVRLAELYRADGKVDRARDIVPPPRVTGVTACAAPCFYVYFDSDAGLREGDGSGSASSPSSYLLNGAALPPGSMATLLKAQRQVTVELPSGSTPVAPGDTITVRGIRDLLGEAISPDPTTMTITVAVAPTPAAPTALVALPPRISGVATCGNRPCFYVYLGAGNPITNDDSPGSAKNSENYLLNGRPLPSGTLIAVLETHRQITVEMPASTAPVRPGDTITIRGLTDRSGRRLDPDPTVARIPVPSVPAAQPGAQARVLAATTCYGRPCFYVFFEPGEPLLRDGSEGSTTNIENFLLNDRPMPPGTLADWLEAGRQLIVEMPAGSPVVVVGDVVTVRGIVDRLGRPISPDPTVVTVRHGP